jgi:hypothetical protein
MNFQIIMVWFETQDEITSENIDLKIGLWKAQTIICLDQSKESNKDRYAVEWLLYLAEYYRLLSRDTVVISQLLQDKKPRSVQTDQRIIPTLKLLRTPGTNNSLIQQAIQDIIGLPSQMKRKQFQWPLSGKSEMITIWTILLPLLIFKKEPKFMNDLINRDILPYYKETWKTTTFNFNHMNRRYHELGQLFSM